MFTTAECAEVWRRYKDGSAERWAVSHQRFAANLSTPGASRLRSGGALREYLA
jgi:hypothetical protein